MHFHSFISLSLTLASLQWVAADDTLEPRWIEGQHEIPAHAKRSHHVVRNFGKRADGDEDLHKDWKRAMGPAWTTSPSLTTSQYSTGVGAMQLTVVDSQTILLIDKAENNPLTIKGQFNNAGGKDHPAWMQWLNVYNGKYKALDAQTNSFCAGGTWLGNGTMISVGGNPRVNAASYYNSNGLTGIRMFPRCDDSDCVLYENPAAMRLASARWYPGTVRLSDGSAMILGGMTEGGFNNVAATDNPTFEFYPPKVLGKNNGLPVYSKFLHDTLNSNLFPITYLMPDGRVFVASNTMAMIYDWTTGKETRLANIPNNVRVTYPWSAAAAWLPMTIANNWTPSILFCGGSTLNDKTDVYKLSSQSPASKQCVRMDLSAAGIKKGWIREQDLPEARTMGETVLTPDGKVLILNGAGTGMAGYGNVHNPVGQSNADKPTYRGVIYDPLKPSGKRLSTLMPTSKIPRMYHSVASLLPDGSVIITGSNPNADVSQANYKTDYSIEFLRPSYMNANRPTYTWKPDNIVFGRSFKLRIANVADDLAISSISIVLMDLGYHTHGVAVDQRLLELNARDWCNNNDAKSKGCAATEILVKSPKNGAQFPPGRAWLFVVVNGIPSVGGRVMVGDGSSPPFNAAAQQNMMNQSAKLYGKPFWYK